MFQPFHPLHPLQAPQYHKPHRHHKLLQVSQAPQVPQAPAIPQAPQIPHVPQVPQAPQGQPFVHLNWSNFKPESSGKPGEDAEAHLLHTNDWINAHHFVEGVGVQRFCLTLLGEARL